MKCRAGLCLICIVFCIASPLSTMAVDFDVETIIDSPDLLPGDGQCASLIGGGLCTLRAAIMEANATPGRDRISLPSATFLLTETGIDEDAGQLGDLDISDDLVLEGAGRSETVLDGREADRVLDIRASGGSIVFPEVEIRNLTVRNGSIDAVGGGIKNQSTRLLLEDVNVTQNRGASGGGIFSNGGRLTLRRVTVSQNSSTSEAGGVNIQSTGSLVEDCVIASNSSDSFGAGLRIRAASTVLNTDVVGNRVTGSGADAAGVSADAPFVMYNSSVRSNTIARDDGGTTGIEFSRGPVVIANTTISGHTDFDEFSPTRFRVVASSLPGGIEADLFLINVTLASNATTALGFSTRIFLANTILTGNGQTGNQNCSSANVIHSLGHNIENGTSCGLDAPSDHSNTDPLLGPLAANGGPTPTHAPSQIGLAVDGGGNFACPHTDQRGFARPVGTACDVGAHETAASPACADGLDGDGDGQVDFPADPGCTSAEDPLELNLENGEVLVSDRGEGAVYRIDPATGAETRVVRGLALVEPTGLLWESQGTFLVGDATTGAVLRVDPETGYPSVVVLEGPRRPEDVRLVSALDLARTGDTLLVVDPVSLALFSFHLPTGFRGFDPTTFMLFPPAENPAFSSLQAVLAESDDRALLLDSASAAAGIFEIEISTGDSTPFPTGPPLQSPKGFVLEPGGDLLVTAGGTRDLQRVDREDGTSSALTPINSFLDPQQVAIHGPDALVVDAGARGLARVDRSTGAVAMIPSQGKLLEPYGIATIPEPSRAVLTALGGVALLSLRWHRARRASTGGALSRDRDEGPTQA